MQEDTKATKDTVKKVQKKNGSNLWFYVGVGCGLVFVLVIGYLGWTKYNQIHNTPEAIQAKQQEKEREQKEKILGELRQFMLLPDEDPFLATVADQEQVRNYQAFFKDVENGDVVLLFQRNAKALIYRPSEKLIVNFASINYTNQPAPQSPDTQTPPPQKAPAKK